MVYRFLRGIAVALVLAALAVTGLPGAGTPIPPDVILAAAPGRGSGPEVPLTQPPAAAGTKAAALWRSECADCPPLFGGMSDRYLALDSQGRPHLAYGEDHLYYSWNDGTAWHTEIVDNQPQVGTDASLALDLLGRPHIAYSDLGMTLRYAHFDGTTWQTATLDAAGMMPSIAVDQAGTPGVAYLSSGLRYAWYDGSGWYTETVDGRDWLIYLSQSLDPAGRPHIAYGDSYGVVRHAWHDGSRWYSESLALGSYAQGPLSFVIDGAGQMHLGYVGPYDWPCYGYLDGTAWVTETVVISGMVHFGVAMGLDPWGQPHIAYTEHQDNDIYLLAHVWRTPTGWQHEAVDGNVGYAALAVDTAGHAVISYVVGKELRLARFDGQAWQIEKVDEMGFAGMFPALAVDGTGRPHIVYRSGAESEAGVLKYAWYDGAAWHDEIVDDSSNVGPAENGLALDAADQPHVVYCEGWGGTVHYAHRVDGVWQTEVISPTLYGSPSLALDAAGRPHVAVANSGDVWYAYRDEAGWNVQRVDTWGWGATSLALDGQGYPHFCYASTAYDLRYTWFDGTAWHIEDVAPGTDGTTIDCSLALDASGWPRISYHADSQVRYVWHDGTQWYTQTVDVSTSNLRAYTSLALDAHGHPRIGYIANNCCRSDVHYAAFDGTAWVTETVGNAGWFPYGVSLALDAAGRPRIAYYESDCADLRYAERIPGQTWHFFLPLLRK